MPVTFGDGIEDPMTGKLVPGAPAITNSEDALSQQALDYMFVFKPVDTERAEDAPKINFAKS